MRWGQVTESLRHKMGSCRRRFFCNSWQCLYFSGCYFSCRSVPQCRRLQMNFQCPRTPPNAIHLHCTRSHDPQAFSQRHRASHVHHMKHHRHHAHHHRTIVVGAQSFVPLSPQVASPFDSIDLVSTQTYPSATGLDALPSSVPIPLCNLSVKNTGCRMAGSYCLVGEVEVLDCGNDGGSERGANGERASIWDFGAW